MKGWWAEGEDVVYIYRYPGGILLKGSLSETLYSFIVM